MDPLLGAESAMLAPPAETLPATQYTLTPQLLDEKLQALSHQLTCNITLNVRKISQELHEEIAQVGEHTDALETKYDDLVQYVQALEEENSALKYTV